MNANRMRRLLFLALVCAGIASGCQSRQSSRQLERDVSEELDPRNKWMDKVLTGRGPATGEPKQQRAQTEADFRAGNLDVRPVGSR